VLPEWGAGQKNGSAVYASCLVQTGRDIPRPSMKWAVTSLSDLGAMLVFLYAVKSQMF
jgi:hypothetical protein